jgi:hypothetical protein
MRDEAGIAGLIAQLHFVSRIVGRKCALSHREMWDVTGYIQLVN